jgi:hypothetical protein
MPYTFQNDAGVPVKQLDLRLSYRFHPTIRDGRFGREDKGTLAVSIPLRTANLPSFSLQALEMPANPGFHPHYR